VLGSTCNVNAGNAAHSVALNEGNGTKLGALGPGTAGQIPRSGGSGADPTYIDFPEVQRFYAATCTNTTPTAIWDVPASGAATPACRTGTNVNAGVLQFAHSNSAQFQVEIPGDWDSSGAVYASIYFTQAGNTNVGQTIIMQMATGCSQTTDDPSFNAVQAFSTATTVATAQTPYIETLSSVTMTGCVAGGNMNVEIVRSGVDAATTAPNVYWVALTFPRLVTTGQAD